MNTKVSPSSLTVEPLADSFPESIEWKEPVKKEKVKTRRPADPTRAKPQPKKVLSVENIEPHNHTHSIPPNSYKVFLALVGESSERNITLNQVVTLLEKGLKCIITKATTGSHGKVTDPKTQEIWTIPPAWDDPVPPY